MLIEGLVKGTTVANIVGEIECFDTKNNLFGHILFDPDNRLNSLWDKLKSKFKLPNFLTG